MQQLLELVKKAHASADYQPLVDLIPYARVLGVQCECYGEEIIFRLPANADNIGNPTIPAIHGGVIASLHGADRTVSAHAAAAATGAGQDHRLLTRLHAGGTGS